MADLVSFGHNCRLSGYLQTLVKEKTMEIRYALVKELPDLEYDDAVAKATELLADEGFGVRRPSRRRSTSTSGATSSSVPATRNSRTRRLPVSPSSAFSCRAMSL